MKCLNVGCGMTPIPGWVNIDNSFSVKLSKHPLLSFLLHKLKLIDSHQMSYVRFCQKNDILWADVTQKIPLPASSVKILYSSHMLEHLDRDQAVLFLGEAIRVLSTRGTIRLVVPDIAKKIEDYLENKDADAFIESTSMCAPSPRTLVQRIMHSVVGDRHHKWMYDGSSLSKLLLEAGFSEPVILKAGETRIENPSELDLFERREESVYVEATKN
jgi:predicted SAM-dependent methyltransferase